jgi:hypothetical protein
MKTIGLISILSIMISVLLLLTSLPPVLAKDIDVSLTGEFSYDRGKWGSGQYPSPTGTTHKVVWGSGGHIQIIYNKWAWQPTFEFSFNRRNFDFMSDKAPIQETVIYDYTFLIGVTKDLKYFSAYALAGYTLLENHIRFIEVWNGGLLNHGRPEISNNLFSVKVGGYKLFDIGGIKIGPEISLIAYSAMPGWSRCRTFTSNRFIPQAGIRLQW